MLSHVSELRSMWFCCIDGLRLLPAVRILHRGFALSAKNAASLSNVDRNLAAAAAESNISQSDAATDIDPLKCHDFFGVRGLVTLADLFDHRVHLGHKVGVRDPHMVPYLFGSRLGIDIIDLEQSTALLSDALNFLAHVAFRGGIVMFVSRHVQTIPLVERTAVECGEYAYCSMWRHGTFTNSSTKFGAITRLPDTVIFTSTLNNVFETHEAVTETAKMNIPSIGIVDSSCDPRLITYPVPGNDDTPCAVELYCRLFKEAIVRGKVKAKELKSSAMEHHN